MQGISLLQDLAIALLAAGVAGMLCKRAGLSVIVGYLLAGMIIGPYTPPFSLITDVPRIETLSQVGLTFLMFSIGLGLSITKLRQMGVGTLIATCLGAFFVLNLTQVVGLVAGWSSVQSLFVAGMFMISSSAVIAKIIREMNLDHERTGQLAIGITVQEDVVAVVMLAVLAGQGAASTTGAQGDGHLSSLLIGLVAFVVLLVCTGLLFVPRLLKRIGNTNADDELRTLLVAGLLFLMAVISVKAGYSLALGAFLLGAIVAEMPQKNGVEKAFSGARDIFSAVFFVAIGMMIDVKLFAEVWLVIFGLGAVMIVVRVLAVGLALIVVGQPPSEARHVSLLLIPVGEFSFLIAQLGVQSKVLPERAYPIVVGISMLTVFATPIINRRAGPLLAFFDRVDPAWFKRLIAVYHRWLGHLSSLGQGSSAWGPARARLGKIAIQLLFVTGLLTFSGLILRSLRENPQLNAFDPVWFNMVFWAGLAVLVLIPLIAVWRDLAALAHVVALATTERTPHLPARLVASLVKLLGGAALIYWLSQVLPVAALSRWAWLVVIIVMAAIIAVFYRRLVALDDNWQADMAGTLAGGESTSAAKTAVTLGDQPWLDNARSWNLNVQECVLPEHVAIAGHTLRELDVRARFGCSVVEIERQGTVLIAPDLSTRLYAGDRLLLLGPAGNLERARTALSTLQANPDSRSIDESRLESVAVPAGFPRTMSVLEMQDAAGSHVLIVGIQHNGERRVNPVGGDLIQPADILLVLGEPDKITSLRQWLMTKTLGS